MRHILLLLFFIITSFLSAQNFRVQSQTVTTTSPDSCSTIDVDVLTWLGCINFTQGPATYQVNGNVIDIEVNYTSSFICAGAISQPLFQISMQNIAPGTYTLTSTALLDNVATNSVSGTLTVAGCMATGIEENSLSQLKLYPNPVANKLNIQLAGNNDQDLSYDIKDIRGKVIQSGTINSTLNQSIDVSQQSAGIYFIELSNKSSSRILKFIKH